MERWQLILLAVAALWFLNRRDAAPGGPAPYIWPQVRL